MGNTKQRIGDDQLVHGMPKHMAATATGNAGKTAGADGLQTFWRFHPKPGACDTCQAMRDVWFKDKPGPVHPNCKCEIEEFQVLTVDGRTDIIIPPNVDLAANIAEARRKAKECEKEAIKVVEEMEEKLRRTHPLALRSFEREGSVDMWKQYLIRHWVYQNFCNGARYDFKQLGQEYEAFGNYHYGLYTKAIGINETFARMAAGFAQVKAKTSKWSWFYTYFDDPLDYEAIVKGQSRLTD